MDFTRHPHLAVGIANNLDLSMGISDSDVR
jgi:hypothetical protein